MGRTVHGNRLGGHGWLVTQRLGLKREFTRNCMMAHRKWHPPTDLSCLTHSFFLKSSVHRTVRKYPIIPTSEDLEELQVYKHFWRIPKHMQKKKLLQTWCGSMSRSSSLSCGHLSPRILFSRPSVPCRTANEKKQLKLEFCFFAQERRVLYPIFCLQSFQ